jgi:hypothetical protein
MTLFALRTRKSLKNGCLVEGSERAPSTSLDSGRGTSAPVSDAHDGPGNGSISAYDVTANGVRDPISGLPF